MLSLKLNIRNIDIIVALWYTEIGNSKYKNAHYRRGFMFYIYHAKATEPNKENPVTAGKVKIITVSKHDRKYLKKKDYMWKILTLGKYRKVLVLNENDDMMHFSTVIGPNFKFPFLKRKEAEIGPCSTRIAYRGQGIYPSVLKYILGSGWYQDYYMLIEDTNLSSIRGVEKAGFVQVAKVKKNRFGQWVKMK